MYQLKLLIVMGLFVMALSVGCLTGCTTKYQKITKPDGTTIEFWNFEFHPNLLPNLLNYEVQYFGLSEQGLPIQKMSPKIRLNLRGISRSKFRNKPMKR